MHQLPHTLHPLQLLQTHSSRPPLPGQAHTPHHPSRAPHNPTRRQESVQQRAAASQGATSLARGILIVAGGQSNLANAAVTVRVLRRHLNCSLPLEIVHFGLQDEGDRRLVRLMQQYGTGSPGSGDGGDGSSDGGAAIGLRRRGVEAPVFVTDASDPAFEAQHAAHQRRVQVGSYASKAFALAFITRFQEVRGQG